MKLFGVISDERAFKSKSPAMHNAVLREYGPPGVYVPFPVKPDRVGEAVRGLLALGASGANVTVPYKETVIPFLDGLSPEAQSIGAVNTIVPGPDRLIGHNTDAAGFLDALTLAGFNPKGQTALVIGAGGAAKAVVYALKNAGASRVILAGRRETQVADTARPFGAEPRDLTWLAQNSIETPLLVNATSVSSFEESPTLAALAESLDMPGLKLVMDLNYGRPENFWRSRAQRLGAAFQDGLPMLALQARKSYILWTGREVGAEVFIKALEEAT